MRPALVVAPAGSRELAVEKIASNASVDHAERPHDSHRAAAQRQQLRNDGEALVLGPAIGFHERAGGGAELARAAPDRSEAPAAPLPARARCCT